MERPSIVSDSPAKGKRPGATLLAAALSLLLHAGGVLAFVVLPWEDGAQRTVEVGGMEAIDVVVVSGSQAGGAAGSGTPESEGEAAAEDLERTALPAPEPLPQPVPEPVREAEAKPEPEPAREPEPQPVAAPDPEPLPVLTAETPSRDPVPPPPDARPAEVEERAVTAAAEAAPPPEREAQTEPADQPQPETARDEASPEPQQAVERPALRRSTHREGQLARLGAEDAAAENPGQGGSGATGTERQGAAPLAGNPAPTYPRQARRRGWEGRAVLEVRVDVEGNPAQVRLLESSGYDLLDRTALETVEGWRFTPARRADTREADTLKVPIRFALQ